MPRVDSWANTLTPFLGRFVNAHVDRADRYGLWTKSGVIAKEQQEAADAGGGFSGWTGAVSSSAELGKIYGAIGYTNSTNGRYYNKNGGLHAEPWTGPNTGVNDIGNAGGIPVYAIAKGTVDHS